MQHRVSVITLGVTDLARSKRFYVKGFGWKPVLDTDEIVFYQMNGFVLGTWLKAKLEEDMKQQASPAPGAYTLAHNVTDPLQVTRILTQLAEQGGTLLRAADQPPHGGLRGYIADPDGHTWEIAWNPAWPISPEGYVTAKF
ncbi:MAG: VOC family protein [Rhodospirillaceae bacterium]|nr:VOC family protein [Rhodospirillaceae bacterium]